MRIRSAELKVLLTCLICSSLVLAETQLYADGKDNASVYISRVRLEIGGDTYLWNEDGITADDSGKTGGTENNPTILPETIISFLSVCPGKIGTPSEIERWCRESEIRLQDSGYVYAASVQVIPPRKNPDKRTILISVSPGFFLRFGGGNAYGIFGKDCIGGERASFRAYAGWNRNGVNYTHYRVADLPLVLGGSLFWYGPGKNTSLTDAAGNSIPANRAEAVETLGWFVQPNILAGIDISEAADCFPKETTTDAASDSSLFGNTLFSIQPFISWNAYLIPGDPNKYGNESNLGCDARLIIFPALFAIKGEASGFVHWRILSGTTLAFEAAGGAATDAVSFDLFSTEDRSVRSGYTQEELSSGSFLYSSFELRQRIFAFTILPMFPCIVQAFLFGDVAGFTPAGTAIISDTGSEISDQVNYADAWGAGLRILFDNPVFAYFTFSYGLNHNGEGRFLFCGTAGY